MEAACHAWEAPSLIKFHQVWKYHQTYPYQIRTTPGQALGSSISGSTDIGSSSLGAWLAGREEGIAKTQLQKRSNPTFTFSLHHPLHVNLKPDLTHQLGDGLTQRCHVIQGHDGEQCAHPKRKAANGWKMRGRNQVLKRVKWNHVMWKQYCCF